MTGRKAEPRVVRRAKALKKTRVHKAPEIRAPKRTVIRPSPRAPRTVAKDLGPHPDYPVEITAAGRVVRVKEPDRLCPNCGTSEGYSTPLTNSRGEIVARQCTCGTHF